MVARLSLGLEGRIGLTSVAHTIHLAISYRLLKITTREPKQTSYFVPKTPLLILKAIVL